MTCQHLDEAGDPPALTPYADGCRECVAGGHTKSDWVHLRMCLVCGLVACCDSSPQQHMTRHHEQSGHPVMRSYEPGESWRWCYPDELLG